jgi:hypothetical protein
VVNLAAAAVDRYPTYVIGVGNWSALDAIAVAGGTGSAFMVNVDNPEQTQRDFLAAINQIRGAALPCDLEIPPPPENETLDPTLVNVTFTPPGGSTTLFYQSADCASDLGWRYDNPDAPTRIELCPNACQTVKAGAGGKLDVAFGCATVLDVR